jgi:hypothetical protein
LSSTHLIAPSGPPVPVHPRRRGPWPQRAAFVPYGVLRQPRPPRLLAKPNRNIHARFDRHHAALIIEVRMTSTLTT